MSLLRGGSPIVVRVSSDPTALGSEPQILVQISGNAVGAWAAGRPGWQGRKGSSPLPSETPRSSGVWGGRAVSSRGITFTPIPAGPCHAPAAPSCTCIPPSLEKRAENERWGPSTCWPGDAEDDSPPQLLPHCSMSWAPTSNCPTAGTPTTVPCAWLNAEQLFIEDEHSLGCPAGKRGALPLLRRSPSKTPQQAQALGAPAEKAGAQPRWRQADPRVSPNTANSHWG